MQARAPSPQPQATTTAQPTAHGLAKPVAGISWHWPAEGRIAKVDANAAKKGLEIWGKSGQPVKAAADGTVVYSGAGIGGFGELIIVKHNEAYLSAYAHNRKLFAKEGARVQAGQKIAEMGGPDDRDIKLYFEIRRNGKTVDPLSYLPRS
jgi:lipoprotein NlpD